MMIVTHSQAHFMKKKEEEMEELRSNACVPMEGEKKTAQQLAQSVQPIALVVVQGKADDEKDTKETQN